MSDHTTRTTTAWAKPSAVADLDIAFGVDVVSRFMPSMAEIPEEFKAHRGKWQDVQADWFFSGLHGAKWTPREGIETRAALRHIKAIQGSWEPKHEHKAAAVAYLLSLWFEDVTYVKGDHR